MITCALSDKQLRSLRVKVAGDLLDLVKPDNKENFNLKNYLKAIYDIVNTNTNNQNSAIDYARMAGVFIKQVYGRDQRLTPLRKKGYSNDEVDDYTIAASDPKKGFEYVAEFLGVNTNPSTDLAEIKNALTIDEHIKTVQDAIVKKNSNTVYGETLKPNSAITTSIQELIDGNVEKGQDPRMLFYTQFTKDILDKIYTSGKQDLAGVPYEGVSGGLHVSLVRYTEIDINDTYPYVKDVLMSGQEKDYIIQDYNNAFVYVITDKDGNVVRFNEDYAVAENGKPIYYNARYLPQKNSDGSFKVDNVTNTQTPSEIAKGLNISLDEAREKLNSEFQMLEAAYRYISEAKGNRITYSIMGGSYGAQVHNNDKPIPFSTVNLKGSTVTFKFLNKDVVFKGSRAGIYMSTDKGSTKYLIYGPSLSEDVVNNLVTLVTEDVVDKSGNRIGNDVKVKLMGTYLLNSIKDLLYGVDKNTGELFIRYQGEKIKLGDKTAAKEKLTEAFSTNAQGFGRLYPINTDKANSNEKVTLFSVKPGANPVVTTEQVPYVDYLKSFATVMASLGADGTIAQYNPYFALAPVMAQALKIIAPETLPKKPVGEKETYNGIEVIDSSDIKAATGEPGAAKYDRANNKILINREFLKKKFAEKAWTKSRKQKDGSFATALAEDAFATYQDFENFVMEHEYQHSLLTYEQSGAKTVGEYEDIINNRALKTKGTKETKTTTENKPEEFVNHSGGAYGGDTFWDVIGREFGVVQHKHYREKGNTTLSKKLKAAGVQATVLTEEQMEAARDEVERLLGKKYPNTTEGNLQVRNYYQVANSDSVFAVATLNKKGDGVTGGTNTAVQLGIKLNKPVYVWDIASENWTKWDGTKFTNTEVPTLTKNFAGVGSRDIESYPMPLEKDASGKVTKWGTTTDTGKYKGKEKEEAASRAIREVYEKTFGKPGQATETKPVINIYWGNAESSTNTKVLSNLAPRKFTYQGKEYGSVEHAYQTLKSGEFDQNIYDKYVQAGGYGKKIRGKAVTKGFDNLQLMRDLVVESFKQNPDKAALLLNYSDFTHTTNEVIDKAFLEGVRLAQKNAQQASTKESKPEVNAPVKTVSEAYGVVTAETNPSETTTRQFVSLIQPQIKAQAYQENVTGNKMFMYGLRWTRKNKAKAPLTNKSYANKGLATTDSKAKDGYVYDTVDQNGNPLAPISDLQPIIKEIEKTLGIDMSNYDAVIGNIYLPGQRIQTHRDTTESLSARNYPVVVYTLGAGNAINVYEDTKNPGSISFASSKKTTIPTKNGTIYTFGMGGKGRFELAHDTPTAIAKGETLEPITMPNGDVIKDYTITLTFRRAADLEPGMATSPGVSATQAEAPAPIQEVKAQVINEATTQMFQRRGRTSADDPTLNNFLNNKDFLNRYKNKLDKQTNIEATKEQIRLAKEWYAKSPLSKHIKLNIMFNAVNTAVPNGVARWDVNGITLFKGSDFSDLYHEAWHGFTQMFLSAEERAALYDEARKASGKFKSFDGKIIDFATATDEQLEEYMAEDFREYMLGNGKKVLDKTPVKKNIFQKILDVLRYLFTGIRYQDGVTNGMNNPKIQALYDKLRVGNLTEYTFNQENAQFPGGLNKTKMDSVDPNNLRFLPQISADTSRLISTTVDALFSEAIDYLNRGNNTKAYTTAVIKTDEGRKIGYKYAESALTTSLYNALLDRNDMVQQGLDTAAIDKEIDTLSWALANFGDTNDLSNPQGVIKYHMENSGLLEFEDRTTEVKDDSKLYQKNEFESKAGNETAQKSLASPNLIYTLRSLNDYNKDKSIKLNALGYPKLMDFNRAWNRMMNITEGAKDIDDIYNKLSAASVDYPVVAQFLSKIGAPSNMERSSQELWTEITKIFTMKRIPLVELHAEVIQSIDPSTKKYNTEVSFTPSRAGGEYRKVGSKWDNLFAVMQPNKYITVDNNNVNTLNIRAVLEDFPAVDSKNVFGFMEAIGMPLEDNPTVLKALENTENGAMKAIKDIHRTIQYGIYKYNNGPGLSTPIIITRPSQLFAQYKVNTKDSRLNITLGGESKKFTAIQKFHLAWSDDFSDTTVSNAEGENQYEKSMRSTVINMIDAINNAATETALTQEGVEGADDLSMNHLAKSRNPFMKTSFFMRSIFDENGNKRIYTNEYGDRIEAGIELLNMSGASLTKQNVRGIIDESGVASSNADETTKLLEDFYMMMLYGVSEATRHADKSTTYLYRLIQANPKAKHLIKLSSFTENLDADNRVISDGKYAFIQMLTGYLASEYERIQKVREEEVAGNATVGKSTYAKEGAEFVIFDKILDEKTKTALKKFRSSSLAEPVITAEQFLKKLEGSKLRDSVEKQIGDYLTAQTKEFTQKLNELSFFNNSNLTNPVIKNMLRDKEYFNSLTADRKKEITESIAEAYVANSWVQNYETVMMFYGDPGLYNHAKDEFFKRNAGVGATGTIPRTDLYMQDYINSRLSGLSYANTKYGLAPKRFSKTMTSAVLSDPITESIYADEYIKAAKAWEKERLKKIGASAKEIKEALARVEELYTPYKEMTEGDGQGWINFDAYRALLISLNKWSPYQEELYAKIVNGEDVSTEDVYQFFPVKKMQYWGPLKTDGLPVYAFHKYSLMPLIPNVIQGKNLEGLQKKMLEQGVDYALLQSGSKINTLTKDGKADKFYNDSTSNTDKTVAYTAEDYDFTPNEIFLNYFKDQLEVHDHYSDKVTFSTQLRKLIEDGLMENGVPVDWRTNITDPEARMTAWEDASDTEKDESDNYKKLIKYESLLNRLVELKKNKLRQEIGTNLNQLMLFVKKELNRQELAEHELDFVNDAGDLKYSIELSLSADKIEKMLVAVVQKRLINQKINGEALVQVSGVGFEDANKSMRNATKKEIKKYGTNGLTFYTKKEDGTTAAMKIKVAIQGSFKNLLELPEVQELVSDTVTPLDALNTLLKDEAWLSTGDNRKMVTMVAARIPVQGLNSMEFMEVYEFLPENAGNIVILPAEIVAKSGGDFDIDKMYTLMPNIKRQTSEISKQTIENISEMLGRKIGKKDIQNAINIRENEFPLTEEDQKILDYVDNFSTEEVKIGLVKGDNVKAIENDLIASSVEILSMPANFTSLITPNSTDIVKPISKFMAKTMRGESGMVSPTEIFEIGRNLYKHQSNSIGKAVLGVIAVNNTFNTLFSRTGLVMDDFITIAETNEGSTRMRQQLRLPHNTINGKISLSSLYSNEKLGTKISDVINQMINGAVDVAKDAWIFDIQGNKEVIPSLLFMIQAGVPVRQAVYFVSQPMIQQYVKTQRLLKSQFAQPIGLDDPGMFYRIHARDSIVTNVMNGLTANPEDLYNDKGRVDKTKVFGLFANWAQVGERADLFTEANLEKNLSAKGEYTDTDRAAFAHFLEIQEMASQITKLTMALKFDNDKTTTLFDARAKLAKIGELANGISPESIRKISEESPIAAFKIQDFILELYSDLFPLRDNPAVVQAIERLYMKNDDGVTPIMSVKKELGMDDEQFQRTFRNDFAHYLFQNDYYKFDRNTKTYGGLNVEVNEVESLFAAARMKEGKLYVNKKQIETLYQSKAYSRNTAWSHRMAPVPSYVFDMYDTAETKSLGLDLFTKFMYEREVIRTFAKNSVENIEKTDEFKYYYETFKSEETDESRRYKSYESVLRDKALGNLNIPGYMFFGDNAYGRQVMQLKAKYPQLFETYAVLNNLESFTKNYGTSSMTNLKFSNTLYTADDLNIYHENLLDLMNPSVQKVEDAAENRRISELFEKLPIFAMLQSAGDTKSTYSLVRAMPPSVTVPLLEKPVNEFLALSTEEKYQRLGRYFVKFKKQYNKTNYLKSKLKDFLISDGNEVAKGGTEKRIINLQELEELVEAADDSQSEDVSARTVTVNGVPISLDALGIDFQPNDQQLEALDRIAKFLTEDYDQSVEPIDNMYTLMGYAGTGKTSITKILLEYLDIIGKTVEVTATTHKAKGVIRGAIDRGVSTIHKALNLKPNIDIAKPLDLSKLNMIQGDKDKIIAPDILVIDESSFIGESLFEYIKTFAEDQDVKILFIGDPAQIKPVEETKNGVEVTAKKNSPVFETVENFSELTKVERQATGNPLGPILDAIRSNLQSAAEVFPHESNVSGNQGIAFTDSGKQFVKNLVSAFSSDNFKKNRNFARAITYTNDRVNSLNEAIRSGLGFSQEYTPGEILMGYDNHKMKKDGSYTVHNSADYVILESEYISNKELGSNLSSIGINSVTVSGYKVTIQDLADSAVKETIFIVDKTNDDSVFNQLAETVEAIQAKSKTGGAQVWAGYYYPFIESFVSSRAVTVGGRTVIKKGIDYGYAHTIHKSQGATYTNIFVDYSSTDKSRDTEERNQMRYVALSRATNIAYAFSGDVVGTPPAIDWNSSFGEEKVVAGKTTQVKVSAKTEADILTLDRIGIYEDTKTGIRTFRYTKEKGMPAKGVLTEETAKLFAIDYPDAVPVYNETSNLDRNIAGTNTVWRETGLGIGIPTKKNARPTKSDSLELNAKDAFTDETLDDNKAAIDSAIAQLLNEKGKGKELIFDANGYGQYMIGYNETTGQKLNSNPVAQETFLYLSEQLFSNFGYINPHYLDYVQGRRNVQKSAPITDDEILEQIKQCFSKK